MMSSILSEGILPGKYSLLEYTHLHGVRQLVRKDLHKIYKFRISFLVAEKNMGTS